jgi:hypothetical protein
MSAILSLLLAVEPMYFLSRLILRPLSVDLSDSTQPKGIDTFLEYVFPRETRLLQHQLSFGQGSSQNVCRCRAYTVGDLMPGSSAIAGSERAAGRRGWAATAGLAQLSLIEHALCPLDTKVSLRDGFRYSTGFFYGPSGRRRFGNVTLTAANGLSPGDEFFLWGLLALTLADRDGGIEFWATPHYCLRRLGCIGDGTTKGGGNYESFRQAIGRLAAVTYTSDAFFDPVRSEHRQVAFGFLSYSLPLDPACPARGGSFGIRCSWSSAGQRAAGGCSLTSICTGIWISPAAGCS